ncbi:cgi121 protein [Grosmannia clavigera kw1407]|uniref:EKC/KEOPS complex subunit CGI121 n=1 Tax=Grosmannia clavigera (strain kw1407 / UAMH 11150) TaxID=655863 RepID=F0XMR2_GROCL|nr:cgi121 protein [Grosmannia clavigera kw1407]EFX01422.1 cgi121 protein [Grosmannia clavigera kw1407]
MSATATAAASALETVAVEHLPPGYAVHAVLFRDVQNAAFLQAQLVARNAAFEYALVDASTVVSRAHLLAAVHKAILAHVGGSLKTPNVHSETVLSLSPSLNIAEAYRRFGVTADTKNVLVVKILLPNASTTADDIWLHLSSNVEGTAVPPSEAAIESGTDVHKVKKYFKLNSVPSLAGRTDSAEKRRELEVLTLGAMALRGL